MTLRGPGRVWTKVYKGMHGTVLRTTRRDILVRLDDEHVHDERSEIVLPRWYVGEHVDHAYAITADKAQGSTVDDVLFAPSPATAIGGDFAIDFA